MQEWLVVMRSSQGHPGRGGRTRGLSVQKQGQEAGGIVDGDVTKVNLAELGGTFRIWGNLGELGGTWGNFARILRLQSFRVN